MQQDCPTAGNRDGIGPVKTFFTKHSYDIFQKCIWFNLFPHLKPFVLGAISRIELRALQPWISLDSRGIRTADWQY